MLSFFLVFPLSHYLKLFVLDILLSRTYAQNNKKKKHSPSPPPVFFLFVKNFKRFSRVRKAMILFIPLSCMLFLVQKLSITMGLSKSVSKFIKKSIFPVSKSEVKPMAASSAKHSTLLGTGCLLQLGKA